MICNHHANEAPGVPCSCVATYEAIVAGEDIPRAEAYVALCREAAKHPELLKDYPSDLVVHDRAALLTYSGPFLWVLRELGTVLMIPRGRDGEQTVQGVLHAFGDGGVWRFWDGRRLWPITPERAEEWLRDETRKRREKGRAA